MAAAVGHIEVVEKLVEAGCTWPHGKKANSGLGAPVDVVQLLAQKTDMQVGLHGNCLSAALGRAIGADHCDNSNQITLQTHLQL